MSAEAVAALIGVVIGAIATGAADYFLQRRREKMEIRRAGRLLLLELREAQQFIEESLEYLRWTAMPERVFSNEVWIEQRTAFSAVGDERVWEAVSSGFLAIARVRRKNLSAEPGTALHPDEPRTLDAEAELDLVRTAIKRLSAFLGVGSRRLGFRSARRKPPTPLS